MYEHLDAAVCINSNSNYFIACKAIAQEIQNYGCLSIKEVLRIRKNISSKYDLNTLPKNEHIIQYLPTNSNYRNTLMVKPRRSASGVIVIAVMPKPYDCPHGRCIYCPGGIEYNTPLSYIGTEPSTKAAQMFEYDPYKQIQYKLKQLYDRGHDVGKVELVIVGGTFPFMPAEYQKGFAKSCYDALNGTESSVNLEQSIKINENANIRCVGFTVETKPDYCRRHNIDLMLELGITRIEIGVQALQDDVYRAVNRGHTLNDVVNAFHLARDAGYKIVAHMMPGLPHSSPKKDIQDFKKLFHDERFKPDMLKIYPTLVIKGTGLYKLHKSGSYCAYSDNDLIDILVEVKKIVPPWVRIMRVQREIESKDIVAGPKSGNLRQIVLQRLHDEGLECGCIRCREAGLQGRCINEDEVDMNRIDYLASGGQEVFISFESSDKSSILGFLRLRKVLNSFRSELRGREGDVDNSSAVVRELHVYGQMLNLGKKGNDNSCQHKGYGTQLMQEAERITKYEFGLNKLAVISAVGTRQYYKRLGYDMDGPYVSKVL